VRKIKIETVVVIVVFTRENTDFGDGPRGVSHDPVSCRDLKQTGTPLDLCPRGGHDLSGIYYDDGGERERERERQREIEREREREAYEISLKV